MNLLKLKDYQQKPDPFAPGESLFWDDPHVSVHMLKAHLDPASDLASRRPETIQRSVDWLIAYGLFTRVRWGYLLALANLILFGSVSFWLMSQNFQQPYTGIPPGRL